MSTIPASVKCDGCGKNRIEDTNHWMTLDACSYKGVLSFATGIFENDEMGNPANHACGRECATKLFQKWFAEGKL